jgi:hypothetical protein
LGHARDPRWSQLLLITFIISVARRKLLCERQTLHVFSLLASYRRLHLDFHRATTVVAFLASCLKPTLRCTADAVDIKISR